MTNLYARNDCEDDQLDNGNDMVDSLLSFLMLLSLLEEMVEERMDEEKRWLKSIFDSIAGLIATCQKVCEATAMYLYMEGKIGKKEIEKLANDPYILSAAIRFAVYGDCSTKAYDRLCAKIGQKRYDMQVYIALTFMVGKVIKQKDNEWLTMCLNTFFDPEGVLTSQGDAFASLLGEELAEGDKERAFYAKTMLLLLHDKQSTCPTQTLFRQAVAAIK